MAFTTGDETPTKCRLRGSKSHSSEHDVALESAYLKQCTGQRTRPEVAKVFQMEYHIVILVKGAATNDKFCLIHGELSVPLLTLDHVNAKTVHHAMERGTYIPGFLELCTHFDMTVRACTTDGAGYMKKYKRAFTTLHPNATKFELDCDIHTWNNCLGSAIKVLDYDVSGCHANQNMISSILNESLHSKQSRQCVY
jgi:hypothetical protein